MLFTLDVKLKIITLKGKTELLQKPKLRISQGLNAKIVILK